ncbi:hypothetical protein ABE042_00810 [Viridibacillus arvi]
MQQTAELAQQTTHLAQQTVVLAQQSPNSKGNQNLLLSNLEITANIGG